MLPECTQSAEGGKLYVIGTPIGNMWDLSLRAAKILETVDVLACEDTRVTGKLLSRFEIKKKMISYRDANEEAQTAVIVEALKEGKSVGLVSDAGMPAVSDPGFRVVRQCRREGLEVVSVPGPAAFVAALSVSGLPSDRFRFVGFLAAKSAARRRFFEEIRESEETVILYESSHRIEKFINEALEVLGGQRVISLGREITKLHETFLVGGIEEVLVEFNKRSQKGEFVVIIAPEKFKL